MIDNGDVFHVGKSSLSGKVAIHTRVDVVVQEIYILRDATTNEFSIITSKIVDAIIVKIILVIGIAAWIERIDVGIVSHPISWRADEDGRSCIETSLCSG